MPWIGCASDNGESYALRRTIVPLVLPTPEICRRAHVARDSRFDGRFVVGVLSTGVFCRPICPARTPRADNARYFATAAAALAAGYRPCRRCRPESAPSLLAGSLGNDIVLRALRLVDEGFLDDHDSAALAAAVGVGGRHLRRLFGQELGAGPTVLARGRRLLVATRLLDESDLAITDVAMGAGYGSLRSFNAAFRAAFGESPSARRRSGNGRRPHAALALRATFREPYDAAWVTSFLQGRSIAGLEAVVEGRYRRRLGEDVWLEAAIAPGALRVSIPAPAIGASADLLARLRRVFDLDADPEPVDARLRRVPRLARCVRRAPGIRVPGVWDPFEGAVRAILGQQVSVARATALAATLYERFGAAAFPTARALAEADVAAVGMPGRRGGAVSAVARRVLAEGDAWLRDPEALRSGFARIRGIGPWTTEYAAMRVGRDPDAFPASDWGVLKVLGGKASDALRWAEPCRPWRAYAAMHLWRSRTPPLRRPQTAGLD